MCVAAVLCTATAAWGQEINASPSIVGSGARALGMGGAFIAVADDATAASWNPGGLTQLERPEVSVVYSWKWLGEQWDDTPFILPEDDYLVRLRDINYFSVAYPFQRTIAGRNFVISLNYLRRYDYDRSMDFRARFSQPFTGLIYDARANIGFDQEGSLSTLSPAFGFELTDRLSCGVVMNLWDSDIVETNGWESFTQRRSLGDIHVIGGGSLQVIGRNDTYKKYENFEGTNYSFGLLYKPTERLSVGAVYHTKFTSHVDYTRLDFGAGIFPYSSRLRMDWPSAAGLGIAYRFPNDKLTLSLDVTRQDWDQYVQIDPQSSIWADGFQNRRHSFPLVSSWSHRKSPITNLPKWMSPHDATFTVRLGAEYVFVDPNKPLANYLPSVRAGVFYDPEPASGRKEHWWGVDPIGDGKPENYYGVALGAGVLIKNRVNIDAAYQYRWGSDVKRDTFVDEGQLENGFKIDAGQHLVYLSTVIYF